MQQSRTSLFLKKNVKSKIDVFSHFFNSEYITKNVELVTAFLGATVLAPQINYK
jgi:hypothetical protein